MIVLISRGYVTGRTRIAGTLAAVAASTLLAGCGLGGGGGSATPSPGSSAAVTPVVSSAGAGAEEQAVNASSAASAAAGTVSRETVGKITGGSTGSYTHASATFSVAHPQVADGSRGSLTTAPTQARRPASHPSGTKAGAPSPTTSPPASQPAQTQPAAPKIRVEIETRYKVRVETVYRNRTITKTVVKTVAPKIPAGGFLPSKHPQLGQRAFTTTGANVGCEIGQAGVHCGIKDRNWTAPAQPPSCRSTWGFTIALARRGLPGFACGGRNPINLGAKVIPAGWDDQVGNYSCEVRSFGVNCFNTKSRSGFLLSRTGYTLY